MKSLSLFFVLSMLLSVSNLVSADNMPLQDCITKKLVECSIKINESGTHYTGQFILDIKNLKPTPITLVIQPGLLYIAEDDPKQNFVTTKEEIITLTPSGSRTLAIQAMCIENSDSAPDDDSRYKIGTLADGNLLEMAKFVNDKKLYGKSETQSAIWCVANGNSITSIMGADTTINKSLMEMVSKLTGQKMPTRQALSGYEYDYYSTDYKVQVSGEFEYKISKVAEITIGMFDRNNIIVRELYNNPQQPIGNHKLEFSFDATVYTNDLYYFKLLRNGEVVLNMEYEKD